MRGLVLAVRLMLWLPASLSATTTSSPLSVRDVIALAENAATSGDIAQALQLLEQLRIEDQRLPDVRFARALLLLESSRYSEAERELTALVIAQPKMPRIRLELGRALAEQRKYGGAERQFRRALAGDIPDSVRRTVNAAINNVRSKRRWSGSFNVGLAPDSNINNATSAETVNAFNLEFTLSPEARQTSGVGLLASGDIGWRQPLSRTLAVSADAAAYIRKYTSTRFDDFTTEVRLGLEWTPTPELRLIPQVTYLHRWYGGQSYNAAISAGVKADVRIGKDWFASARLDARKQNYISADFLDGWTYAARIRADHALTPATLVSISTGLSRDVASSAVYSTWSKDADVSLSHDWQRGWITNGQIGIARVTSDGANPFFGKPRAETRLRIGAGVSHRRFRWRDFTPLLRVNYERSASDISIYRYQRLRSEIILASTF
jgi:outer membrane protein